MRQTSLAVCLPILLADKFGLDPNQIGLLQWGDGLVLLLGNQVPSRNRRRNRTRNRSGATASCSSCLGNQVQLVVPRLLSLVAQ